MAVTKASNSSIKNPNAKYVSFLAGNAAYEPSQFFSIATVTATGVETSLTFSSIPSTYKALQIRYFAKGTISNYGVIDTYMRFNSDSGSNYSDHFLRGNGSSVSASANTSYDKIYFGKLADSLYSNIFAAGIIDVQDYATSKNKTVKTFNGIDQNDIYDTGWVYLSSGLWMSSSAVTSITFAPLSGNFAAGSTFALYGIAG